MSLKKLIKKLYGGSLRSQKAKKHISLSLVYKVLDIFLGFLLIPMILLYITNEEYGIWTVLFSFANMLNFLNIGLDGGLRNKLAMCLAQNKNEDAKYYTSTAYFTIVLISIFFISLFYFINPYINWIKVLNAPEKYSQIISYLVFYVYASFFLVLALKLITSILYADQKPSLVNLYNMLQKLFSIILILLLIYQTESSLLLLGIALSFSPALVLLIYNFYFFSKDYKNFIPKLRYFRFEYLKDIMNLGIKLFIIRIAVVILFATDNFVITQLFGPEEVVPYHIAHKYFTIPLMFFTIFSQALWSATTDAYYRNEINWIKNAVKKLIKLWRYSLIAIVLMLLLSSFIFDIWLQGKVNVILSISIGWALFAALQTFNAIYVNVLNGIGKMKLQLYTAINVILLNMPLSVFFALNLNLGVSGVIFATNALIVLSILLRMIQFNKIMNKTAKGFWDE